MSVLLDAGSGDAANAIPVTPLCVGQVEPWLAGQPESARRWIASLRFMAQPATWIGLPGADGALSRVLTGAPPYEDLYALAHLPMTLPEGTYRLELPAFVRDVQPSSFERVALGFALGAYAFTKYRAPKRKPARLVLPAGVDLAAVERLAAAVMKVRDLVNTPTEDMGPADLEAAARALGEAHGARVRTVVGDELVAQNFPAIHAVGRASHRAPRLIELEWGDSSHPR